MSFPEFRVFVSSFSRKLPTQVGNKSKNRQRALASLVAAIAVVDCSSRLHATTQTSTWVGGANTSWNDNLNWNANNVFPNNGNGSISDFDVIINSVSSPDVAPILNTSVTIDNLTLNTGATLGIQGASDLTLNDNVVDDGSITINSNNSNFSTITFSGGTLSGTGTITLNSGNTGANVAGTLTQSSGHTINGLGEITAALTNNSTVDANVSGQAITLLTSNMTNNSVMEATGGGDLVINAITVTQGTSGQFSASGTSSIVALDGNATISGGALNTSSGGIFQATNNSTDTLANVTNNGTFNIIGASNLNITGNLVDNGAITVNSNNSSASTLTFSGGTLSGTGTITLNSSGAGAVLAGTFTQSSGHTINGLGEIIGAITNNSTVNANVSGQAITLLTSNMTNNSLMEATGGGDLVVDGITVTQGASGQFSASGTNSIVALDGNATISGGTLNTSSGGIFQATNNSTDTLANVTNKGTFNIIGASDLNITGNLVDDGAIIVNSNSSSASTLTFSGGTLSGTGTITLNSSGGGADVAGTLTQSSGHTINGYGEISAALTNNGLVNASVAGTTLFVSGATTINTSTMEATSGVLAFNNSGAVTNTGGTIDAASNDVVINGAASITGGTLEATSPNFILVQGATFNGVTITANTNVDVQGSFNLTLTGSTLTNNGNIALNSNNSNFSTLQVNSDLLLTGSGSLTLNSSSTSAVIATGTSDTLTQDVNHTINGYGEITAVFTNNGTVDANNNGNELILTTSNMTNNKLMEATAGGILLISGITVTQGTNGQIGASGTSSLVALEVNSTISGGTLNTSSGGIFQATANSTDTLASVTNDATFDIVGASGLNITGNLVNNGAITVNSNNSNFSTMSFNGSTLSGTGTITLNSNSTGAVLAGTLTQSSGHTINGVGTIVAALTNNSTVDASVSSQTITLETSNMTNNSVMEATGGGNLTINGITVTQGTGGQISASGASSSIALIGNATISGGTLTTAAGDVVQAVDNSTDTLASVTNNATVDIIGASSIDVTGNLVDNGTVIVNSNNSNFSTLSFNGGSLSGPGTVTLNSGAIGADLAGTLTQASGHTINGYGEITAALTNNSTVDANVSSQTINLQTSNMTNNSVMEATGGGNITINAITVTQGASGQINASGTGSSITLVGGATISGGTLTTSAGDFVQANSGGTDTLNHVTSNATVNIVGGTNLAITGGIVNNGTLSVDSNTSNFSTATVTGGAITGTGTITIQSGGLLAMGHSIGGSSQDSLSITGSGQLDLNNNHMFINYGTGPDPITSIAAWVISGFNHGGWNGSGIISTAAQTNSASYGIGYADSADPGNPAGLANHQIEIMYTLLGDANLDGKVNGADFTILAANFNKTVTDGWDEGDFNYDNDVNGADFTLLANNFNQSAIQSDVAAADLTALNDFVATNGITLTNVPEPASAAILVTVGLGILRRRRKPSRH